MAKTYTLTIVTREGVVFAGEVQALVAPGEAGSLGVLANHAPLMTLLAPGRFEITDRAGTKRIGRVGPGLLDVYQNTATVITDSLDLP